MTPTDPTDFTSFFTVLLNALENKQWWPLASMVLIGLVSFTRFFVPRLHGKLGVFLNTDRGAALLVLFYATLGAAATTVSAWKTPNLALLSTSVFIAIDAAGGFSLFKKILFPNPMQAVVAADAVTATKVADIVKAVQEVDVAKKIELPPPIRPALLPFAFLLASSVLVAGCACGLPENKNSPMCRILDVVVNCGGSAVGQGVMALIEAVLPAVVGSQIDWSALTTLEEKYGTDAVMCALQQAQTSATRLMAQRRIPESNHLLDNVKKIFAARHVTIIQGSAP